MLKEAKVVFWENEPFPTNPSSIQWSESGLPIIELYSLNQIKPLAHLPLIGITDSGKYLAVFKLTVLDQGESHHDLGRIAAPNSSISNNYFSCYYIKYILEDYICSNARIDSNNIPISSISISTRDFQSLATHTGINSIPDDPQITQLFSNQEVSISLVEKALESRCLYSMKKDFDFSLLLNFNNEIDYIPAINNWVAPLLYLMGIICGGIVNIEHHVITSESRNLRFEGSRVIALNKKGSAPRSFQTSKLPLEITDFNFQKLISEWMERPNTLRGICAELLATHYGDVYTHSKAIASMRGIEAIFADHTIQEKMTESSIPINSQGTFDMLSSNYKSIHKLLSNLQSAPSFAKKLDSCIARFKHQFEGIRANGINWDSFASEAKILRNETAHGTVVGGITERSEESSLLIARTCFEMFALAVVSLAYECDEKVPLLPRINGPITIGKELAQQWPAG